MAFVQLLAALIVLGIVCDDSHAHAEAWDGASLLAKLVERHAGAHTGTPYLLLRRLPLFSLYEICYRLQHPRALPRLYIKYGRTCLQ